MRDRRAPVRRRRAALTKVDGYPWLSFKIWAWPLGPSSLDASGAFEATLKGFNAFDRIVFDATATDASFSAGVLTLTDGGVTVAKLNLSGAYAGDTFVAVPLAQA